MGGWFCHQEYNAARPFVWRSLDSLFFRQRSQFEFDLFVLPKDFRVGDIIHFPFGFFFLLVWLAKKSRSEIVCGKVRKIDSNEVDRSNSRKTVLLVVRVSYKSSPRMSIHGQTFEWWKIVWEESWSCIFQPHAFQGEVALRSVHPQSPSSRSCRKVTPYFSH